MSGTAAQRRPEHVGAHNIVPHVEAALARAEALRAELAASRAKGH
ncbi:MAG: hypothetical protein Q7J25_07875 [Vicinamibacterales bacterium]|nr:hypothetical protein [Vicinamibacterales bacterium]